MKNIVILTGAGISAESGLSTFRGSGGLWNNHSIYDVATPEAWQNNKQLVLDFYNHRRSELQKVNPNPAHTSLAALQKHFNIQIITQNVDDLHERSGSKNVLHLHGSLTQARGDKSTHPVIDIGYKDIRLGDTNINGEQLRPNIVWFGEDVPLIELAHQICLTADFLIIIGTSLQVYPAAGLIHAVPQNCETYLIDPNAEELSELNLITVIRQKASIAVPKLVQKLITISNS